MAIYESMIASTIHFAAKLMPDGEGFAGEHAKRGWQNLYSLALRPIMMVFGLVVALILMNTIVGFVMSEFIPYAISVMEGRLDFTGIISNLFFTILLTIFIIVIIHTTHSLIYELHDNVVRYVSFESRPNASKEAGSKVGGFVSTTSSKTEAVLASGGKTPKPPGGGGGAKSSSNNKDVDASTKAADKGLDQATKQGPK